MCCNAQNECHATSDKIKLGTTFVLVLSIIMSVLCCILIFSFSFWFGKTRSMKSIEKVSHKTGIDSCYIFILGKNPIGWCVSALIVVFQFFLLNQFLVASDFRLEETSDWKYNWNCPINVPECEIDRQQQRTSWFLFVSLMLVKLVPDLYAGCWLCYFSPRVEIKSKQWQTFISGLVLFSISSFSFLVTIYYNLATARSDTDLILNAVIILFVTEIDEEVLKVLVSVKPNLTNYIMVAISDIKNQPLASTSADVANSLEEHSKLILELQEIVCDMQKRLKENEEVGSKKDL
mmetsp:Transcript_12146/g.26580  ORF Transcript_12146/g.26580 Transcript_12146/m.26580 type:complete len:291 (-) Transcript_12146:38-910(-)